MQRSGSGICDNALLFFAAHGLRHQDPDRVPDPRPSQGPARQDAAGEIPDPGDDVRGRAGEAAEGEKREEKEEGQGPSQGMALNAPTGKTVWTQNDSVLSMTCVGFYLSCYHKGIYCSLSPLT